MANRVPLIINTTANQIQELALGDCLDLTASGIHNAGVITATKFVGDGSLLTNVGGGGGASGISDIVEDTTPQLGGNLDINGNIINGTGSIVINGGIQATSFTGSVVGDVTGNVSGSAGSASGLTGNPAIQVASIVATGHIQAETVSVASTLTYEDVTSIDSIGIVTARSGIKVLGGGIDAVGTITATAFSGDGSGLTNVGGGINDIVDDTTPQLGGNLDINGKTINGTGNITITGNVTATNLSGSLPASNLTGALPAIDGSALTGIDASPGGSNTQFQYNNAGSFEGLNTLTTDGTDVTFVGDVGNSTPEDANMTWDRSTDKLKFGKYCALDFYNGNTTFNDNGGYSFWINHSSNGTMNINAATRKGIMVDGSDNTSVSLYEGDSLRFKTTPSGVTVTGVVSDSKGDLRQMPINFHNASTYTLVASDAGKVVSEATMGATITVPASTFVGGDAVTLMNHTGNVHTIDCSAITMYLSGDTSAKSSLTLAGRGLATIFFREHNVAYISGSGLS